MVKPKLIAKLHRTSTKQIPFYFIRSLIFSIQLFQWLVLQSLSRPRPKMMVLLHTWTLLDFEILILIENWRIPFNLISISLMTKTPWYFFQNLFFLCNVMNSNTVTVMHYLRIFTLLEYEIFSIFRLFHHVFTAIHIEHQRRRISNNLKVCQFFLFNV